MDTIDRGILNLLQFSFPLTTRPYLSIARSLDRSERDVIDRIAGLMEKRIVIRMGPIFNSFNIGYHSTLAAFKVASNRVEEVANHLSAHPGVSHNYLRDGTVNLWFTLTLPESKDLRGELKRLAKELHVDQWLFLPTIRTFKIGFQLDMQGKSASAPPPTAVPGQSGSGGHTKVSKEFVRVLQKNLPLVGRPYRHAANALGLTEGKVVERLRRCIAGGTIRRIAAILSPVRAGYAANVMVSWAPKSVDRERLGIYAASHGLVSHCYWRQNSPNWPYSIYTMIHGHSMAECRTVIRDIARNTKVRHYRELATKKEFKKERVVYHAD